jgi:glycosyltransferase involved in cell wall biosynthesis
MTQLGVIKEIFSGLSGIKVAVDLTPMLPGGENGGAKWMTLELVHALAKRLPKTSFVLLTAESSHAELDWLENSCSNIQRICVLHNITTTPPSITASPPSSSFKARVLKRTKYLAGVLLPEGLKQRVETAPLLIAAWKARTFEQLEVFAKRLLPSAIKRLIRRWPKDTLPESVSTSLLGQIGADLLFCPFTAPFYADPRIPTVSVIYDLQYRSYPQFFTPEEVLQREENFRTAYQRAGYLVTISDFVRQTVLAAAQLSPERVISVPIGLLRIPKNPEHESSLKELLERYSLRRGEYILYPANFWQHKNHAMLLTAFSLYRRAHPGSTLKLLCTGASGPGAEAFCEAVRRMGLEDWVVYPGYVLPDEYDFFLRGAFAVVFPSLYEGFGIPVLEAMFVGVPVFCSNITSLPEVGGEAVLYFDPRRPGQIVENLTRLSEEPGLRESLINKGLQRSLRFEGADRMAVEYMNVFARALQMNSDSVKGSGPANGALN